MLAGENMSFATLTTHLENITEVNFANIAVLKNFKKQLNRIIRDTQKYLENHCPAFYFLVEKTLGDLRTQSQIQPQDLEDNNQETFNCLLSFIKFSLRVIHNCNYHHTFLDDDAQEETKKIKQWFSNCLGYALKIPKKNREETFKNITTLKIETFYNDEETLSLRRTNTAKTDIKFALAFGRLYGFIKPISHQNTESNRINFDQEHTLSAIAKTVFNNFKDGSYYLHKATNDFIQKILTSSAESFMLSKKIAQEQQTATQENLTAIIKKLLNNTGTVLKNTRYSWFRSLFSNSDTIAQTHGQNILNSLEESSKPNELVNIKLIDGLLTIYHSADWSSFGIKKTCLKALSKLITLLSENLPFEPSLNTLVSIFCRLTPEMSTEFHLEEKLLTSFKQMNINKKMEFICKLIEQEKTQETWHPILNRLISSTIQIAIKQSDKVSSEEMHNLFSQVELRKKSIANQTQPYEKINSQTRNQELKIATNGLTAILVDRDIKQKKIEADEAFSKNLEAIWESVKTNTEKITSTIHLLKQILVSRALLLNDEQKLDWVTNTLGGLPENTLNLKEKAELAIQALSILFQYSTLTDDQKLQLIKDILDNTNENLAETDKNNILEKAVNVLRNYSNLEDKLINGLSPLPVAETGLADDIEQPTDYTKIECAIHEIGINTSGTKKQYFYIQLQHALKKITALQNQSSLITDLAITITKLLNQHPQKECQLTEFTFDSINNLVAYIVHKLKFAWSKAPQFDQNNLTTEVINFCLTQLKQLPPTGRSVVLNRDNKTFISARLVLTAIDLEKLDTSETDTYLKPSSANPTVFTQTFFVKKPKVISVPTQPQSPSLSPRKDYEYKVAIGLGLATNKEFDLPARGTKDPVPGEMRGKYIIVSDKPAGIEPGFICFINNETFQIAVKEIIDDILKNPLHDKYDFFSSHKTNPDLRTSPDDVTHFLQNDTCRKVIFELAAEKVPLWLVKQDYQDPKPGEDTVTVDESGIAGTNTMKEATANFEGTFLENAVKRLITSIYQIARSKSPIKENGNAILECLSTTIAANIFMPSQKQHLLKGEYDTGNLKFMTCSEWKKGFHDFSNQLVTDGRVGFLVKKGTCASDDSINNLGRHLTFALLCSDYDFMGSRGGNKGRVGNDFFGIDFGHAFRDPNKIIGHVQDDFSLDWKNSTVKKFKNLSVFNDTLLSEKMQGLLLLYKLRMSKTDTIPTIIQEAVNSHGETFAAKFAEIQPGSDEEIFTTYESYFTEKAKDEPSRTEEYKKYLKKVTQAKQFYLNAATQLLDKFKDRIMLTTQQLDFIDNLEKLCSETTHKQTLQTEKGEKIIQFNHLKKLNRVKFQIHSQEGEWLTIHTVQKSTWLDFFNSPKSTKSIIEEFLGQNPIHRYWKQDEKGNIFLTIYKKDFDEYQKIFAEAKIAEFKGQPLVSTQDSIESIQPRRSLAS